MAPRRICVVVDAYVVKPLQLVELDPLHQVVALVADHGADGSHMRAIRGYDCQAGMLSYRVVDEAEEQVVG